MAEKITHIGGQAVVEGILMRGKGVAALSVRKPDGTVETVGMKGKPPRRGFWKLPVARGVMAFVDSMVDGISAIYKSAELSGLDEADEAPGKFDLWLERKFGDKLTGYVMNVALAISVLFSVGLFMVLPVGIARLIRPLTGEGSVAMSVAEGLIRICVFLTYLALLSRTKSIKRLFGYHGAEHKTIHCLEAGRELTVENARACSRLHKRCGTSFLLIVMLISMVVFFFVRTPTVWLRLLSRVALVPVIAGLSYEALKWAGRSESKLVSVLAWPGLQLQRLTTNEPDDGELEVAIAAMNAVLEAEKANDAV